MNPDLVAKSLCFHGQPLQKIWEGERGSHDLYRLGLTNPDFSIYMARQKTLTFQDRAKRLKLHQFIARKATILFDTNLVDDVVANKNKEKPIPGASIIMPPFESFLSKGIEKSKHLHHILGVIQPGDIVYCTVISRTASGLIVKVLCSGEPVTRYLADVNIKAYVVTQYLVPAHDKKGNPKPFMTNDYVCCEVLDISVDADRMTLGMKGTLTIDPKAPLGLISSDQLPEYYKKIIENPEATYEELLEKSRGFENPNCVDNLFQEFGLDVNETFSNMSSLKYRFPQQEYAAELRQVQASKWAFRSVADGIEHFKVGRHSEAFQCLNKALNIDPRNVEGLVARGALYANSGSFKKAVEDFETALKLNPYHANARKYMGETLVALGRSYEEENRMEEARKAYTDCLNIIPTHEEAKSSLEFLNGKSGQGKQLIDTNELLPSLKLPGDSKKESPTSSKRYDDGKREKSSKKNKKKGRKRKNSSSSSSSDESSASTGSSSSETSTSSDSSTTSSDSDSSPKRKKKSRSSKTRQKSLSPLSKRMALMDQEHPTTGTTRYQFNQPFHLANIATNAGGDDYDTKVRNFLEMTRDDDDYESRVRKLVEEASKHRKERKGTDEKSKKKEKKKQKKAKKESKKEKKRKEKNKDKLDLEGIDNMELKEALKIFKQLPMLDIGSKLSADLAKYEKSIEMLQKRRDAPSTSKSQIEIDVDDDKLKKEKRPPTPPAASSTNVKKPETPPVKVAPVKEKLRTPEPIKTLPPKPPVVLDKFGCFRLAAPEEQRVEPPRRSPSQPARHRYSRSRSRSRHYRRSRSARRSRSIRASRSRSPRRSRSRSFRRSRSVRRSRSPRRSRSIRRSRSSRSPRRSYSRRRSFSRRRVRSRSRSDHRRSPSPFGRRSRSFDSGDRRRWSRSRSRSYSRSRSRSPQPWRRGRRGGPFRGRNFGFRGRGRGRGRGGFRGRRSPPFRRDNSYDDSPKERNRDEESYNSSRNRRRSPSSPTVDGKWAHDKYEKTTKDASAEPTNTSNNGGQEEENWDDDGKNNAEPSVEEIDKIINQAQKERKVEIMQRDKNLLKKPTPTNLPF